MKRKYSIIAISLVLLALPGLMSSCDDEEPEPDLIAASIELVSGNKYYTVTIGSQLWMAENLRTATYNDGGAISNVTDDTEWASLTTAAMCAYNNTSDTDSINYYGRLYNWNAVNTGKLCPTGWHVPSYDEWITLKYFLINNGYNFDGSTSDNKIGKAMASTSAWPVSPTIGDIGNRQELNNSSGFTALPAGSRSDNGTFYNNGDDGYWWVSTGVTSGDYSDYFRLAYDLDALYMGNKIIENGQSIRCVKPSPS